MTESKGTSGESGAGGRRRAAVTRETRETAVEIRLDLDGEGRVEATTGIPFFDHMLAQLGTHAGFDLEVRTRGDLEVDGHHTVEDTGLALGQALAEALGDRAGIRRFGFAAAPMDEALVEVALDLSGRPFVVHEVEVAPVMLGTYDPGLTEDFVRALAQTAGLTVHVRMRSGRSPHHVLESEFKALARALRDACAPSGRRGVPSTKGSLG